MATWAEREGRRIDKARILIGPGVTGASGTWADLGCGDGIFTAALYSLVAPGSRIYAVDKNQRALRALAHNFGESYPDASPHTMLADFTQPLALPPLDGFLMANSLHFVKEKRMVLGGVVRLLKPAGRLVVVEYNTSRGNYAVPHPLDEKGFLALAKQMGLRQVAILAKIPSSFLGEMYAGTGVARGESEL
jgi:ubiquinone/menaquinone biosynthesis C-methylase UbiE